MENKIESIPTIQSLLNQSFLVAKYQRGYKWGLEQVLLLLDDIQQFYSDRTSSFYCLQPIIVTKSIKDGKNVWEVIDGQQRLTTVYIILKVISGVTYELDYSTRQRSKVFLEKIETNINEIIPLENDYKKANKKLESAWQEFIKANRDFNNIDNYHFYKAYQYINHWFAITGIDKAEFHKNLLNDVRFIWHEVKEDQKDAEKIFINFNNGKIPLDQADLIKAEFILQIRQSNINKEIQELKSQNFAIEWNRIENTLQNDVFWYFVSNSTSESKKYNRIDFLFDLYFDKPSKADRLFSYFRLKEEGYKESDWFEIRDLFELICEWFENRTIYHLIGIILTFRLKKLKDILELYKSSSHKQVFINELKIKVKDTYFDDDEEMVFVEYSERELCTRILVLYNIAIEECNDSSSKFPFEKLKTTSWNLEHIHAQNTKKFTTKKEVSTWLNDIKILQSKIQNEQQSLPDDLIEALLKDLEDMHDEDAFTSSQRDSIEQIDEKIKNYFVTDSINNLCLLDESTNKGIGNNSFNEKRKEILKIAKEGKNKYDEPVFVPLGTQRVFSKFYNLEQSEVQMSYWGSDDRQLYMNSLKETILGFLKPVTND